jgi:hypothetical protein
MFSSDLLKVDDEALMKYWDQCKAETCTPEIRGWYQERYKATLANSAVADVGPGLGLDGIWFAEHGAHVTFVDIVEDNLTLLRRLCRLKGIDADFYYVNDFFKYSFTRTFDCFLCIGSLINAPLDFTKRQVDALSPFLRVGRPRPDARLPEGTLRAVRRTRWSGICRHHRWPAYTLGRVV